MRSRLDSGLTEFMKISTATAIGFAVMGFIGFFVRLIHIPINSILLGSYLPHAPYTITALTFLSRGARVLPGAWPGRVLEKTTSCQGELALLTREYYRGLLSRFSYFRIRLNRLTVQLCTQG